MKEGSSRPDIADQARKGSTKALTTSHACSGILGNEITDTNHNMQNRTKRFQTAASTA